ncbi:MAG: helix-turn-helix domain-containing protein [Pseudonocardiaceae bacterium]
MGRTPSELNPDASVRHEFGAELRRLRGIRGFSQVGLGALIMHSGSTVAKVEKAQRWPSRDFAQRCDTVLDARGKLLALWERAERERITGLATVQRFRRLASMLGSGVPLIDETAALTVSGTQPRELASRIVTDLLSLRTIAAGDSQGDRLRQLLDDTIGCLIGSARHDPA